VIYEPLELVEKLAALVPPPRFNLVRYNGMLAPSAAWRPLVIPESDVSDSPTHHDGMLSVGTGHAFTSFIIGESAACHPSPGS
jgi:hypothetical protein